jgi:N-acyl-D-amino-acid deacylase
VSATESYDLVLSGLIYDGTGAQPFEGFVGVTGEEISYVGNEKITGTREIAAPAISAGFIDIHTHSDLSMALDGRCESKLFQGVTTDVSGNCAFGAVPINRERIAEHTAHLQGMDFTGGGYQASDISWNDLNGYRATLQARGIAQNNAPLVGHGNLRIAAMGLKEGGAKGADLARMEELLERELALGAFGMSTGLTYVPSRYADIDELVALGKVLKKHNRVYASHARDYDILGDDDFFGVVNEALEVGRRSGVRVQYSHAAINQPHRWGMAGKWTDIFAAAVKEGVDACFDVYPYDASSSALTQYLPAWVQADGIDAMATRLADPETFARAESDLAKGWGALEIPWQWNRVMLSATEGLLNTKAGQRIDAAARERNLTPEHLVLELCRLGGNRVMVVLFYRTEEDMRTFIRSPHSMICSDGSAIAFKQSKALPHPRSYGAAVRALGFIGREKHDLPLEEIIYKMSGKVAAHMGIHDRGVLAVGKAADIVAFDPATVRDQATFTEPGQPPIGIDYVIVNGQIAVAGGVQSEVRAGKVLSAL